MPGTNRFSFLSYKLLVNQINKNNPINSTDKINSSNSTNSINKIFL